MGDVTCDLQTLDHKRPNELAERLSGVSPVTPFVEHSSGQQSSQLVASYGYQKTRPARERSFPSTVDSIDCRYIERWIPTDKDGRERKLRNAYLHLYHHKGPEQEPDEILAFHWEPGGANENQSLLRPHFHLTTSPQPLGHSHIFTTLTVSPKDQSSVQYLNGLLDEVIATVKVEFLDRISGNGYGW